MKEIEQLEVDCPMLPPCEWRGPVTAMEVSEVSYYRQRLMNTADVQ